MACNGLKKGPFHLFRHPNWSGSLLEKHIFDPFSRHFGILGGPKRATTSSNRAKNTCFGIPCGPRTFLKKVIFFAPGRPCRPILVPTSLGYHLQLAAAHWA